MAELDPKLQEIWKRIDEDHRLYRQSGLGISATAIALFVLLFQGLRSGIQCPSLREYLTVLWLGVLVLGIGSALLVQVFHYFGYKTFAERWFPQNLQDTDWANKQKRHSDRQFLLAHWMLRGTLALLVVAAGLSALLWCMRTAPS